MVDKAHCLRIRSQLALRALMLELIPRQINSDAKTVAEELDLVFGKSQTFFYRILGECGNLKGKL
jgi:hypothetical protein